tara:strand:+ start:637 stop:738 length:102 start_codon:yes stop_codon:yes gene_type:complete
MLPVANNIIIINTATASIKLFYNLEELISSKFN